MREGHRGAPPLAAHRRLRVPTHPEHEFAGLAREPGARSAQHAADAVEHSELRRERAGGGTSLKLSPRANSTSRRVADPEALSMSWPSCLTVVPRGT